MASLPEHLMPAPAGRRPLPDEVIASHLRERVLDAATEVFAKRGYQSTTVDHIVTAARIGVGRFYELFDNKEDCLLRAYDRVVAQARERVAATLPAAVPWPEQACAALRSLLDLIAAEPASARLALGVVQTAGAAALGRYEATLDSVVPLLRRGREASPLAAQLPDTLELSILGGLLWFLQQRVEVSTVQPAALFPESAHLLLDPYLGEEAAAALIAAPAGAAAEA